MRRVLAAAVVFVVLPAAAAAQPESRPAATKTIGIVHALDLSQIKVGGTLCKLTTTKSETLAQNFAVGENVAIVCAGGALRTIAIAPLKGPSHSVTVLKSSGPTPPVGGASPPSTDSGVGSLKWSFLSTGTSTITGSVNVTGPIVSISAGPVTNITVGDGTCSLVSPPSLQLQVGVVIQMSCTTYSNGLSSGEIGPPPMPA
jgi:hypothetical protein